jgi:hypothetical protein
VSALFFEVTHVWLKHATLPAPEKSADSSRSETRRKDARTIKKKKKKSQEVQF